jgi:hypothetical protein
MREERRILMTEKELNGITFDWSETLEALCSNGFSQFLGHRTEMEFDKWYQTIGNEVVENITFNLIFSKNYGILYV